MRVLAILLMCAVPTTLAAQTPIAAHVKAEAARIAAAPRAVTVTRMQNARMFWAGIAMVALGTYLTAGAVTFHQESDLENTPALVTPPLLGSTPGTLAPCGTDPMKTAQPIAPCKHNDGLLWMGTSFSAVGGALMIYGGRTVQVTDTPMPGKDVAALITVRF